MSVNVTMPKLGMTMKTGKVSKWHKSEGDRVQQGEDLFEVETEKITNKVEAPASGVLFQIVVPAGEVVSVGAIVAVIAEPGEQVERMEGIKTADVAEVSGQGGRGHYREADWRGSRQGRDPCHPGSQNAWPRNWLWIYLWSRAPGPKVALKKTTLPDIMRRRSAGPK